MQFALVWWFMENVRHHTKSYAGLIVYAADFVACFQCKLNAEVFYEHGMKHFELELKESKTR